MKLQCTNCERKCIRNYQDNDCPHGKQGEFKTMKLKLRPGVYNAWRVSI